MLKSRSSHVRVKIVALLLSLVALWSFAAFVTLREGLNLLSVVQLDEAVGRPSEALVGALQEERRASVVFLARRTAGQRQDLDSQRTRTDAARRTFEQRAGSDDTADSASALLNQRVGEVLTGLTELDRTRRAIDAGSVDRTQAAGVFTGIITGTFRVFSGLAALDAPAVLRDGNVLTAFSRAREVLAQEDALLAGVIAAGRFAGTEHNEFVKLVGAQRVLHADVAAELPAADQARYEQFVNGSAFARFRAAEDTVMQKGRTGAASPIDAQAWQAAVEPVFAELRNLVLQAADDLIRRVRPEGVAVVVRIVLAAGLGLIAVIASIIMSITTARSLVRQLERLRTAAWELANERLPRVVDRLREGKTVDVDAEAPPLAFGTDEVGQLGEAFNAVQRTAIKTAVEQAELRRDVREVFLSLARRTQTLVHRQLTMLDAMERREIEPDELEALFRVDHLATRMRRNAENLIVLSGATPGRGWRKPVPLIDIVRGALAEVEDYARVTVLPIGSAALAGRAVGDVTHLLAELIENATSFSPPATPVQVGGQKVSNGFVIEVEDRGVGMTEVDLAIANEQLRNPPDFKLSSNVRLGLYVVGRLAQRHGVRVELRASPYGGTLAIVLIPSTLVIEAPGAVGQPAGLPAGSEQRDPELDDTAIVPVGAAANGSTGDGHGGPTGTGLGGLTGTGGLTSTGGPTSNGGLTGNGHGGPTGTGHGSLTSTGHGGPTGNGHAAPMRRGTLSGVGTAHGPLGRVTEALGRVTEAPGRVTETPGRVTEAPGRVTETPGRAADPPGRAADPPGWAGAPEQPAEAPGRAGPPGQPADASDLAGAPEQPAETSGRGGESPNGGADRRQPQPAEASRAPGDPEPRVSARVAMPAAAQPVAGLPTRGRPATPGGLAQPAGVTPNGLPRRVRQASLAAPLQQVPTEFGNDTKARTADATRSPEEIRQRLASYQQGTARGRSEAGRAHEAGKEDG